MPMPNILGISFSTRLLGLSIMRSHHLIDYKMKLYKEGWTPAKCDQIRKALITCIEDYNITDICLSIPAHYHKTDNWENIYDCLISLAKEKNILVWEYSYKLLSKVCIQGEKWNKQGLMRSVVYYYNELQTYYNKERRNKSKYYIKMFEAIAVSLIYIKDVVHSNKDKV